VQEGDLCPKCKGELSITKGIEAGHIFQLGQKYSSAMNATFLDKNGKSDFFWMGCYGIGVSRLVAVMIEAGHDEKGCIWNLQTAPYSVLIIVSNIKDNESFEYAKGLYEELKAKGVEVLLDDRDERFGFKMSDFELIGFPYALIVGKDFKNGEVELVKRDGLGKEKLKLDEVKKKILELVN
jgi:prolyl-tRNA synthetase